MTTSHSLAAAIVIDALNVLFFHSRTRSFPSLLQMILLPTVYQCYFLHILCHLQF